MQATKGICRATSTVLAQFGRQLINVKNAGEAKRLIDPFLAQLCGLINLELHPDFFLDSDATITANGKAVSPITAAQCAEDPERSRVFIQAIYSAIHAQLNQADRAQAVRILYAGTGPLGWLLLPLLPLFTHEQLQVVMLDIHPQSLTSLQWLVNYFDLSDRIDDWVCVDAASWQPEHLPVFDLIVSETMKYRLEQEPQVSIFANLEQLLAPTGALIPQQVIIRAELLEQTSNAERSYPLGRLLTLNRKNAADLRQGNEDWLHGAKTLPHIEVELVSIKLLTEIQVFEHYWLTENMSQLTLPQTINNLSLSSQGQLHYRYHLGAYPKLVIEYPQLTTSLVGSEDLSAGGIYHLRRLWQKTQLTKQRQAPAIDEWDLDRAVLDLCGLGLEPGIVLLYRCNQLSELEQAVDRLGLSQSDKNKINDQLRVLSQSHTTTDYENVLSEEQLLCWQQNGYVIIPQVLTKEACEFTCDAIWQFLQADKNQPESWYQCVDKMQHIMVPLFDHPSLQANRENPIIKKVFAQLWQRTDLLMSTDRVSFNPPETATWKFPGPTMHWDVALKAPIPFATQGMIYLTDTFAEQGAFCCVPGFHLQIDEWLASQSQAGFESEQQLQQQDWHQWDSRPIAAQAGDLIIWHQALPHGASANTASQPRMVQYINMYPIQPQCINSGS